MFFSARSNRAFTLIELLVSIGIIGLLLSVGLVSYRSVQKKKQVQFAAIDVRDAIVRARTYAIAPRREDTGVSAYYFGVVSISNQQYEIAKWVDSSSERYQVIETKTLPDGVSFTNPDDLGTIIAFKIVDGGRPVQDNNSWPVEIKIVGSNYSQTITVQKNGQVEIE